MVNKTFISIDGQKPQTLLETLNVTNQDLYPNIYAMFTLIAMPVSPASSERSFSAMHHVNNCLRATITVYKLIRQIMFGLVHI
jgi:hypothetical protein